MERPTWRVKKIVSFRSTTSFEASGVWIEVEDLIFMVITLSNALACHRSSIETLQILSTFVSKMYDDVL